MSKNENGYFQFRIRITNENTLKKINDIAKEKGMSKTILIRELIDKGIEVLEEELKTVEEKKDEVAELKKLLNIIIEQNKLIQDRQMTARVYDKVSEKINNSIYQYILLLLPFTTNGRFKADEELINQILNNTPREIASLKNELLYQLVEGSNLLDKNERDVK